MGDNVEAYILMPRPAAEATEQAATQQQTTTAEHLYLKERCLAQEQELEYMKHKLSSERTHARVLALQAALQCTQSDISKSDADEVLAVARQFAAFIHEGA